MIKIENTEVYGWEAAIRGMRNPMNSWDKIDTFGEFMNGVLYKFELGENDLKLMRTLAKAGSDHGKFLRMINVTCDITAPLYWWKEFDTYKIGTVANSCSTMHKIHAKEFTLEDFSCEHLDSINLYHLKTMIDWLNTNRNDYLASKNKLFWWQMIQLLPSSYNQRRTVQMNYEVLRNMYKARWNHKLDDWVYFCEWMHDLPYFKEIILD